MDLDGSVPVQAALAVLAAALALVGCGHEAGLPLFVVVAFGALISVGYAAAYGVRRMLSRRSSSGEQGGRRSRGGEGRAIAIGLLGFGVPLAGAAVAWRFESFDGLVFHTAAATWGAVLLVLVPVAILVSSMVDWYLILPFVHGGFRWAPVWVDDDHLTLNRRRRYAKYWVVHRTLCETVVAVSGALLLAIIFVAVGNAVSRDNTLPTAIESLGGSGIAFALVTYFGPRIAGALEFMLDQSAGIGEWVTVAKRDRYGRDTGQTAYTGLVVDVSVGRGVQIRRAVSFDRKLNGGDRKLEHDVDQQERAVEVFESQVDRAWMFVDLRHAMDIQEARGARPSIADDPAWREQAFMYKGQAQRSRDAAPILDALARSAPYLAIGCLVAFAGIVAVQHVVSSLNPLRHMVSEYANGTSATLMVIGFALWAASLGLAAVGVARTVALAPRWRFPLFALLAVACVGAAVTAIFATQTVAGTLPPGVEWTARGRLHDVGSGLLTLALFATAVVAYFAGVARRMRGLVLGLFVAAVVIDVSLLLVGASVGGLRQRLLLLIACIWELGLLVWLVRRQRG